MIHSQIIFSHMALNISMLHCCILVLGCLLCSYSSQALDEERRRDNAWHVVDVRSLLPSTVCSSLIEEDFNRLTITDRHGPCSSRPTNYKPTDVEILKQDQDRINMIHRRVNSAKTDTIEESLSISLPTQSGILYGIKNYAVKIGMGTPRKDLLVEIDTGSSFSWIQCKPCKTCHNQTDPLFDPKLSSTFSSVPCSSKDCTQLEGSSCSNGNCRYKISYGDNSQSDGLFARDTLTLGTTDTLPNFMFGCGISNTGIFGELDGLIGLGQERVSLISQSSYQYSAMFSYCLPSSSRYTGYLSFGKYTMSNATFISMVQKKDTRSDYYVNLTGLKIGGQLLNMSATVFSAGTIMDSGTVITRLPPTAYVKLRDRFRQLMKRYPLAPSVSELDTCYDFTKYQRIQIPTISFVFSDETTLDLNFADLLSVSKLSRVCLAFAGNSRDSDLGIIGNTQQKTLQVIYDLANQKIGFGSGGCK